MDSKKWSRWYLKNIVNNTFAIQYEDWDYLTTSAGDQFALRGNRADSQDFTLSIDFAKKLSMMSRTEMGEKARQYFIEVEKQYLAIAPKTLSSLDLFAVQLQLAREQQAQIKAIETDVKDLKANTATSFY